MHRRMFESCRCVVSINEMFNLCRYLYFPSFFAVDRSKSNHMHLDQKMWHFVWGREKHHHIIIIIPIRIDTQYTYTQKCMHSECIFTLCSFICWLFCWLSRSHKNSRVLFYFYLFMYVCCI